MSDEKQPETPSAAEVTAKAAPKAEEPKVESEYVAIRDFGARIAHQVLHFSKDDVIEPHIAEPLRALGSPIRVVEKLVKETKGRQ